MLDRVAGWKPPLPGEVLGGIYDFILTLKQERPHGGNFAYRSIETDVLGWVLERATGRGLADLLSRELWQSERRSTSRWIAARKWRSKSPRG